MALHVVTPCTLVDKYQFQSKMFLPSSAMDYVTKSNVLLPF